MDVRLRKNFDWPLLMVTFVTAVFGLVTLYSATHDRSPIFLHLQIFWLIVGIFLLVVSTMVDPQRIAKFAGHIYIAILVALVVVVIVGHTSHGAQRWISLGPLRFQPSEFAKLAIILTLAAFFTKKHEKIREFSTLFLSLCYAGLPIALILKQPDLATAVVTIIIWYGMAFMAGARGRHLLFIFLASIAIFALMWHVGLVKNYQKQRLLAFINPNLDPQESGYHIIQSRIAIGSGEVTGQGFLKGTQVQGHFIPEEHTDFIFTVVAEEEGFVGAIGLIALYAILLWRSFLILAGTEDLLGRLLASGIITMLAVHIVINIGMTLGIMPVAGVPLPLFSYGGSNLIVTLISIGLLLGIAKRRHRLVF